MLSFFKDINFFYVGLFMIPWSLVSFFLFESDLHLVFLFVGFILISVSIYKCPRKKGFLKIISKSTIIFIIYLIVAALKNQETLSLLNILFGLICLVFVAYGFVLSKNHFLYSAVNEKTSIFLAILLAFSAISFIDYSGKLETRSFLIEDNLYMVNLYKF